MGLRRICQSTFYYLWLLVAILVIVLALAVSSLRLLVPYADHIKQPVADWFLENYQIHVKYDQLDLSWQRFGLYVALSDVDIDPVEGVDRIKRVDLLSMRIDPTASLLAGGARFGDIRLHGLELDLSTMEATQAGQVSESPLQLLMLELVRSRFTEFELSDFTIHLGDEHEIPSLHVPHLIWSNLNELHQGQGRIRLANDAADAVQFIVKLRGDENHRQQIQGQLYLDVSNLQPHRFVQSYLGDDITITDSLLNFETWINFGWSQIDQVLLSLEQNRLGWQLPKEQQGEAHQLVAERGYFIFETQQDGWNLFSHDLDVHTNGELWQDLNLKVWQRHDQIQTSLEYVDLSLIAPLMEWIPERWELPIPKQMPLKGAVRRLAGQYENSESWRLTAEFSDVGWPQIDHMPGVEMLNGKVYLNQDLLQLDITAPAQVISTGPMFFQNIELEWLETFAQAKREPWGWQFELPQLSLRATDLEAQVTAKGRFGPELPGELYLYGELSLADAGHADYYFPLKKMGSRLSKYLSDALLAGTAEQARILWHGPLKQFPYTDGSGIFQSFIPLRDSRFKFSPSWPALEPFDVDVEFHNNDLLMTGLKAQIDDVHIDDLNAQILGLRKDSLLTINGNITGSATSVRAVMAEAKHVKSVGQALDLIDLKGPVWGALALTIPLNNAKATQVNGHALIDNGEMHVPGAPRHVIANVKGRVDYQQQAFEIKELTGTYHDLPLTISVAGDKADDHYQVDGSVAGSWQAESLKQLPHFWVPGLSGDLSANAVVKTRLDKSGADTQIDINTDLSKLQIDLPAPLTKSLDQSMALTGSIHIDPAQQFNMHFDLAEIADLTWMQDLTAADHQPRIWIGIGATEPDEILEGIQLDITQADLNVDDWAIQLHQQQASKKQHQATESLPFDRGVWQFERLTGKGWFVDQTRIELEKTPLGWLASLSGSAAQGAVRYEVLDRPLFDIKFDHLHVQRPDKAEQQTGSESSEWVAHQQAELAQLPDLDVLCQLCVIGDLSLGSMRLKSYTQADLGRWQVEEAWIRNPYGEILIEDFHWQLNEDAPSSTTLKGKLKADNFGSFAESFFPSSENPIKQSSGKGTIDFTWPGAPYQFDVARAKGVLDWKLGAGHIEELSDKGARVFTLLSIDSLVRKMRLDFSDVFDKGLHYNSFEGDFVLEDGYMKSQKLVMDGVAGDMFISGQTNLTTYELNYDVVFNPNITGSLPILSALTFNPITGVYVLALSAVIKPVVEVVTQVRFKVSGTTDEPIVKEVGRSSREVELQKPKPAEPDVTEQFELPVTEPSEQSDSKGDSSSNESSDQKPSEQKNASPAEVKDELMPELPPEKPIVVGDEGG